MNFGFPSLRDRIGLSMVFRVGREEGIPILFLISAYTSNLSLLPEIRTFEKCAWVVGWGGVNNYSGVQIWSKPSRSICI